ncbi:DNA-binding transcriptional regulator [Fulvivirgaceae bacterium PWU4]|uniref:DNA-binding transcriptional regulator n=1 Tax=Chryseosolibacter histidini TaxID=2782349 RepID=A0AAP2GQE7_9BACT|nr:DNA-binding transcriptional regulator [Chryseosolibacter histidini]MBT1698860.1 DNA-binding transcriptional regulator [Chryseosolibacter histidini]
MIKIILLSDFSEEYSKNLLRGITRYSKDHGPWTFCRMPAYYRETIGIDGILEWAKGWEADGIIGQFHNAEEAWKFTQAKMPVIAQDFKERFEDIPNITGAYHETGRLAADYFLKKGFKNFAFYGLKNTVWSRERAEGFEERVNEAGYKVDYFERQHSRSEDLYHYKPSALTRWLKSLPKPIALMACDDNQAYHVAEASRHFNIRIPEEIALLGVDNDEMLCELSDPPISSIGLDTERSGYEAAALMEQMIARKQGTFKDVVVKPTQVVSRMSTDIFASTDKYIVSALKYIHENLDKNLKVDQVLKEVPLSRRSLEKRFVQITGYPVYEYIYNQRIEKFTQKLLETDMTIFEIALDLGLNDSKNIARQFKQIKGLTPVEYRKKYVLSNRG